MLDWPSGRRWLTEDQRAGVNVRIADMQEAGQRVDRAAIARVIADVTGFIDFEALL